MGLFVCGSVTTITRNCVHRSSPNWVCIGKGSDHLQLIKFWPSCAPGKRVCGGANFFGSALLQPARSVCVSLSAFFLRVTMQLFNFRDGHVTTFRDHSGAYICQMHGHRLSRLEKSTIRTVFLYNKNSILYNKKHTFRVSAFRLAIIGLE